MSGFFFIYLYVVVPLTLRYTVITTVLLLIIYPDFSFVHHFIAGTFAIQDERNKRISVVVRNNLVRTQPN